MSKSTPMTTPARPAHRRALRSTLLALVAAFSLVACSYDPDGEAVWVSKQAVKERLVSPKTADFHHGDTRVAATTADGKLRIVYVVVDSQNKFGAMLPTYALAMVNDRGDHGEVVHMQTFSESPTRADFEKVCEELGEDWKIAEWVSFGKPKA